MQSTYTNPERMREIVSDVARMEADAAAHKATVRAREFDAIVERVVVDAKVHFLAHWANLRGDLFTQNPHDDPEMHTPAFYAIRRSPDARTWLSGFVVSIMSMGLAMNTRTPFFPEDDVLGGANSKLCACGLHVSFCRSTGMLSVSAVAEMAGAGVCDSE